MDNIYYIKFTYYNSYSFRATTHHKHALGRIFKLVVTVLMSLHYSGNFFLYLALNKRFAREMRQLYTAWTRASPNKIISRSSS